MSLKRVVAASFALSVACAAIPACEASAEAPPTVAELRLFTREAMAAARVRGASVALLRQGRVAWIESFGVRDERTGEPVTPQTVFEAASIGKVVAAVGALLRVQDGDWSLDMPASSPRLDVPAGCRAPTLATLLSHTAGLSNDLRAPRFRAICRPPATFAYAGQGYLVVQDLFGDTSGEAAQRFLHDRLFAPLGMDRASFAAPAAADVATGHTDLLYGILTRKALGWGLAVGTMTLVCAALALVVLASWTWRRTSRPRAVVLIAVEASTTMLLLAVAGSLVLVPVEPWSSHVMLPSSLHASIEDLALLARELLRPRLLRPETRDLLLAPRVEVDAELAWAAGIGIDRARDSTTGSVVTSYWQWGSNPGFQGLLVLVPERGDGIAILTNTGGFSDVVLGTWGGYAMAKRLARRALGIHGRWDLVRTAPEPVP